MAEGGAGAAAEGVVADAGEGCVAADICSIKLTVCDGLIALLDAVAGAVGSSAGMASESEAADAPLSDSPAQHNPLSGRLFLASLWQRHHRQAFSYNMWNDASTASPVR